MKNMLINWADLAIERSRGQRTGVFSASNYLMVENRRMRVCNGKFYQSRDWKNTRRVLLSFRNFLARRGVGFYVVIIPDDFQVNKELRQEIFARYPESKKLHSDIDRPQRMLTGFLESEGIEHLDLKPEFMKLAAKQQLYNFRETHLNKRGNAAAADLVADFLKTRIKS